MKCMQNGSGLIKTFFRYSACGSQGIPFLDLSFAAPFLPPSVLLLPLPILDIVQPTQKFGAMFVALHAEKVSKYARLIGGDVEVHACHHPLVAGLPATLRKAGAAERVVLCGTLKSTATYVNSTRCPEAPRMPGQ